MAVLVLLAVSLVVGAGLGLAGWRPAQWVAIGLSVVGLGGNLVALQAGHGRMPVSPAVGTAGLAAVLRSRGYVLVAHGWAARWLGDALVLHFGARAGLAYSPGDLLMAAGVVLVTAGAISGGARGGGEPRQGEVSEAGTLGVSAGAGR